MTGTSRFGLSTTLGSVLGIFVLAAPLAAAPAPKNTSQAVPPLGGSTLVALASVPSLPRLSSPACPGGAACDGPNALAQQMIELVDADRLNPSNDAETGGTAKELKWDRRLAEAALQHSEDMAMHHYFSHVDPEGNSPVERITKAGVSWRTLGENIAKNFSVAAAEEAFMNEPRFQQNHRANILNPKFNYIGIGIVQGPDGMVYVTQEFAQEQ